MREYTPEEIKELLNETMYEWVAGNVEQPNGKNCWTINSIVRIDNRTCLVKYYHWDSTTDAGEISIPKQIPEPVNYEDKTVTNRHWSYADRRHLVSYKISD